MARRIHLTWATSAYRYNLTDGIRLRIEADEAEEMATKIFAYQTLPMTPATGERTAAFDHVCSPVDLEEFPEDEPLAQHRPQWFRLAYLDVLLRSVQEVDDYLADVIADVRSLKATLDTMDTLLPGDDLWIDDEAATDSSSSSVSSTSSSSSSSAGL